MTGKSRRSRAKHSAQVRKKRGPAPSTTAAQQPAATPEYESETTSQPVAPSAEVSAPAPTPPAARHRFITVELKRIGILAGITLGILVVLALFLS